MKTARYLVLLAFSGFFLFYAVSLLVSPKLQYEKNIELGTTNVGVPFFTEIRIRNIGLRTVNVIKSAASCKCTTVQLAGIKIGPFQEVVVPAKVETGRSAGPIKEYVAFDTSVSKEPCKISFSGEVRKTLTIEGATLNIGVVSMANLGKKFTFPFELESGVRSDIVVSAAADTQLRVGIQPSRTGYELNAEFPGIGVGPFKKNIEIKGTSSDGHDVFSVQCAVMGVVAGAWRFEPNVLMFDDKNREVSVTISSQKSINEPDLYVNVFPERIKDSFEVDTHQFPLLRVTFKSEVGVSEAGRIQVGIRDRAEDMVEMPFVISGADVAN